MSDSKQLQAVWLDRVPYGEALALQRELLGRRQRDACPDTLLLLEHPHVVTLGRRGRATDVLASREELAARGVEVIETDRGGQTTYHGPGQLVAYGIIDLYAAGLGSVTYVRSLELAAIDTLGQWGIHAVQIEGKTGVWIAGDQNKVRDPSKIAAIGVKVSRGVTMHGLALNVSTDLSYFQAIVPCGMPGVSAASILSISGVEVEVPDVGIRFAEHLAGHLRRQLEVIGANTLAA